MEPRVVIDIIQEAFTVALFLAMPALLSALFVGLMVSIFQSVTSIQEQTLAFVPKMLAVLLALVIFFSWMQSNITEFTVRLFNSIPDYIS